MSSLSLSCEGHSAARNWEQPPALSQQTNQPTQCYKGKEPFPASNLHELEEEHVSNESTAGGHFDCSQARPSAEDPANQCLDPDPGELCKEYTVI